MKKIVLQAKGLPNTDRKKLAQRKVIRYESDDGARIEGYLTQLDDGMAKRPLIVMPHGGPFARSYYFYNGFTQFFASRGFAVLEPNFRGSTGYGRKHLIHAKGSIHEIMIQDIKSGAEWAIEKGIADPEQIHIMGFSYGGYAALMSAIKYPDFYQSAVSYSAPLDISKQLRWYKKNKAHFAYEYWLEMILKQNKSKKRLQALSPINQIDRLKIPALAFHGEKDTTVPAEHAEKLDDLVEKNDIQNIDVYILKGERHKMALTSNQIFLAEKALELFTRSQ